MIIWVSVGQEFGWFCLMAFHEVVILWRSCQIWRLGWGWRIHFKGVSLTRLVSCCWLLPGGLSAAWWRKHFHWLLTCPHNMAVGSPQSKQGVWETVPWKLRCFVFPSLESPTLSLSWHPIGNTSQPCAKGLGSLWTVLEAGRRTDVFFLNHRFLCPSNGESDNTNSFSKLRHEVQYTGDQFSVQGEKPYTLG